MQNKIKQLALLGKTIMQQPLEYFVKNPFSAEENRSSYFYWSQEFTNGTDRDYKGIDNLIEGAKRTLLDSMRFGRKLIMPYFNLRSFNGSSIKRKETIYQFTTEDDSIVEFNMSTLREVLKYLKTNNASGLYNHQIEIIEDLWQTN